MARFGVTAGRGFLGGTAGGVGIGGSFGVLAATGGLGRCLGHCMTQGGGFLVS